jgi:polysaccharide export outer membrane protein
MTVTVGGEAYVPGSYVVPAVASAFNVLYAAGGPTEDGSLRAIEIRRHGKLISTFDFYAFLRAGGNHKDTILEPGDLIYIPPRLSRVVVRGEVRQPAIYELKPSEMLRDALAVAGGVKPSGVAQRVQVNTVDPGMARVLRDVNIKDAVVVSRTPVYDGDEIDVFSVRATVANRVTVEGAVDQPGDYALAPQMRVSDLVDRARGPLYNAYTTRADLYRTNADSTQTLIPIDLDKAAAHDTANDVALQRWDRLKVYKREDVAWIGKREASVRGAVQRPGAYYRSDNLHVRDLLLMAGGPTPDAYMHRAALLHQHGDGTYSYEYVDIARAMEGTASDDVAVQDDDVLAIYKIGEAQFTPEHTVTVQGEVVAPGIYPRGEGMKLTDLLKLTGGFKPGAGTRVTVAHARRSVDEPPGNLSKVTTQFDSPGNAGPDDDIVLQDNDVVTVQGTGGFISKVPVVMVKGAVNRPGPIAITGQMRLSDIVREAGGLRPEAFPEGAEFTRDADLMATTGQRNLAVVISTLNDLVNQSAYKRALAKSDLERISAANDANQSTTTMSPLGIGAVPTVTQPSAAANAIANQYQKHDLVSEARVLKAENLNPNGVVAVNLAEAIQRPKSSEDILLMDGDTLVVPERPTTVQVVGAVINPQGVLFKPGARLSYYLDLAGGAAPDAALDRIEIIHAGGGLIPASRVKTLQPGDLVLVPTRVLAEKLDKKNGGIDSFLRSLTNSAVMYKVITGLVL